MHFDDRLETVLRLPVNSKALARAQYRQLLDIIGSAQGNTEGPQIDSAYRKLAELAVTIPADERAEMLHPSLSRLRNPRLLAVLADGEPSIASAAIGTARLSEDDWLALIPALPVRARGILRHRRGLGPQIDMLLAQLGISDRGLPPADIDARSAVGEREDEEPLELVELAADEAPLDEPQQGAPTANNDRTAARTSEAENDIATLLKRIEEFSKTRREGPGPNIKQTDTPRLPPEDHVEESQTKRTAPVDFATDTVGRIFWANEAVAPMVVGLRLAPLNQDGALAAPADITRALRHRQPLRNVPVSISGAPAVSGDWQTDAAPRFDRNLGSFTGYSGRFRRPAEDLESSSLSDPGPVETDRVRQILHELRTPANAIQISAEIIQQNLFGPTPHEYRAIAAMIASDIAYVLAGFGELERLAKLEGSVIDAPEGTGDIAAVTGSIVDQLQAYTEKRESGFAFNPTENPIHVGIAEEEVERLVWRLLAALAGEAAPNERLVLSCAQVDDQAVLVAELPAALAARDDEALFRSDADADTVRRTLSAGVFGAGFSLRLARAEAKAASGSLKRDGNHLYLILPALTAHSAAHSQN
jgi:hypothetical protein